MKTVFMGTPDFAASALAALIEGGYEISAVFSQPDKPQGRKMVMTPPPVKVKALEAGIRVYQPSTLKDGRAFELLNEIQPDIIIVVAYGKIIPKAILDLPKFGCINVHASLLPHLRGAAPIQRSILLGDKKTGVSIMRLDEGLDTGDIILQKETDILENETSGELFDRLKVIGAEALLESLELIESGKAEYTPQDDGKSDYAAMLDKSLSPVDWSKSAAEVHNHIRGLEPWPVASANIKGRIVKLYSSRLSDLKGSAPGQVVKAGKELIVCCGDGKCVSIGYVQAPGKNKMPSADFLRGCRLAEGDILN